MLAFLALRPNQAHGREELIELFWPDEPFENGRTCLRTALSSLRRQLNIPDLFVEGTRDTLKLNSLRIGTDVAEFEAAVFSGDPRAASLYGGPFLPGCYDDWALDERNRLEALFESLPPPEPAARQISNDSPPSNKARTATVERSKHLLPNPITRFYGREEEIETLRRLIGGDGARLISVTGLGGIGKTRLAIEVGQSLQPRVTFVGLSELTTHDALPTAFADAFQLDRTPVGSVTTRLRHELATTPTVVIMDNFEQLVGVESGRWIADLLESVPSLAIVVTSRVPLGIEGERIVSLSPLRQSDAVQLFVDRARHVLPDFPESALLPELCDSLDRMPLAIELCASWANVLSSKRMLDGLADRFELMKSRKRNVADRHQSLYAVLEWSCPPDSELRGHLGMLSVLRGRWTLDAAEAILGADAPKLLDALCERSLVNSELHDGEVRFHILQSVRDFATEFVSNDQIYQAKVKHNRFYCDLATKASKLQVTTPLEAFKTLDTEHANIVAALEFGLSSSSEIVEITCRALQRVRWGWWVRGHQSAMTACQAMLAARVEEGFDGAAEMFVLHAAGYHASEVRDFEAAVGFMDRAVERAEACGEIDFMLQIIKDLASNYANLRDWDGGRRSYERAMEIQRHNDIEGYHVTMAHLAGMYLDVAVDVERAEAIYRQLLDFWSIRPNGASHAAVMYRCLGICVMGRKEWAEAESLFRQAIPIFERFGQTIRLSDSWGDLARCLEAQGRSEEAKLAIAEQHKLSLTFCSR